MYINTGVRAVRVAVLGATGYAGLTLLRLLSRHPEFQVESAVSEHAAGQDLNGFIPPHPRLPKRLTSPHEFDQKEPPDLVFSALGAGEGLDRMRSLLDAKSRVIDLAATFRFEAISTYERYYGRHPDPALHQRSFSGYADDPDLRYHQDREILGNPGCYPTAFAVAMLPIVKAVGRIDYLLVDGKSGVSGAGRSPKVHLMLGEMAENVEAYNHPGKHRHTGEMETVSGGRVVFQPHLMPMRQGILLTIYWPQPLVSSDAIQTIWQEAYGLNPFVVLHRDDKKPRTQSVRDSNLVELAVAQDQTTGTVVLYSAIDNLVKGAAGQAIQHANRWFGLDATSGLL